MFRALEGRLAGLQLRPNPGRDATSAPIPRRIAALPAGWAYISGRNEMAEGAIWSERASAGNSLFDREETGKFRVLQSAGYNMTEIRTPNQLFTVKFPK